MPNTEAARPPAARPPAAIIPFPAPSGRPQVWPPARPAEPGQRLCDALAELDAALAVQRAAVADWRNALADLRASVGRLGDGLRRYDAMLGSLGQDVAAVGAQARSLERWADGAPAKR